MSVKYLCAEYPQLVFKVIQEENNEVYCKFQYPGDYFVSMHPGSYFTLIKEKRMINVVIQQAEYSDVPYDTRVSGTCVFRVLTST